MICRQLRFTNWMENFHAWTKRRRPLLLLGVVALDDRGGFRREAAAV